ncbi:ferritin-like domain-containing protein [Thermus thermamylovorans]|uniref:Ferritin-like domain-containing protein n=1 Tax=Thermus thermamylovorans TaxID=2509362 RepID=A0A4Q9B3M6_9DEIN|nr:ferritin-like domain-containing protein [Thermus thermamylovorans]TBH20144.1 ferritin-like domain-containing protein [Thermus thermamylovorans]
MDRETLIQGLNLDLAHEYAAILQYITYAATVTGIHRGELKEFFLGEIQDELRHAQLLADKIAALGGKPTTLPAPVPEAEGPRAMLEAILKAETETIARYVERMKQAEALGDYGLANDLHEIISEETRHKEETEKLLRGRWTE